MQLARRLLRAAAAQRQQIETIGTVGTKRRSSSVANTMVKAVCPTDPFHSLTHTHGKKERTTLGSGAGQALAVSVQSGTNSSPKTKATAR